MVPNAFSFIAVQNNSQDTTYISALFHSQPLFHKHNYSSHRTTQSGISRNTNTQHSHYIYFGVYSVVLVCSEQCSIVKRQLKYIWLKEGKIKVQSKQDETVQCLKLLVKYLTSRQTDSS
jgi:hypothetical protein